jgi:sec-independent protein translocase protein TatC
MPIGPARMPLLSHLNELRKRLTVIVAVLAVATVVAYLFTPQVMQIIVAPVKQFLPQGGKLYFLEPLEAFTVRFTLGFWAALFVTSPIWIWQLMAFLLPALKPKERKFVVPTFFAMVGLFVGGAVFCYFFVLKYSFPWLVQQGGTQMTYLAQAGPMLAVIEFFLLAFGLAFQTPVVVFYLVYFGIVPYQKLRHSWRTVYLVIAVISAGATPDWAPQTMIALAVAMIVLWEGSMLACRLVLRARIKHLASEAAEAEAS